MLNLLNIMPTSHRPAACLIAILISSFAAHAAPSLKPETPRCEYLTNPLGIDVAKPRLMWTLAPVDPKARDLRETACQVLVASTAEKLAKDEGDLWDSGKISRTGVPVIEYAGKPLGSRQACHWKVRVWDQDDKPSEWSAPALWTMGLLTGEDWGGEWIGTTTERHVREPGGTAAFGYHSAEAATPDVAKWVQVDLGKSQPIDEIRLVPARPGNYSPDTPGFGFPVRFKVEVSDSADFSTATMVADQTSEDFPNPGETAAVFTANGVNGRYVRVTATRLWGRSDGAGVFALKRLEIVSGGVNISEKAPVMALDSIERADWNCAALTASASTTGDLNDAAPLLRKAFELPAKKIVSATATLCGLGYQILYINGQRVGTSQLDPGWTEFHKRSLYVTYDVTSMMREGRNAVGVMLGNGFYNPTTKDIWFCNNAPWVAPVALRLNLHVVFADGTSETVVSDGSWQWSTGEIAYQNIRSGETQDKRRTVDGWSKPDFAAVGWKPVIPVTGPKGILRAQMHPPIRTAEEVPAAEITEPKPGVYVFKMAENMTGWTRFRVKGKPGQKITLRHAETLRPDGTINTDLSGFTFGRWQTDEVILGESGEAVFEPHFCYHAFQYVQIEGLESPPSKDSLVGVKVHTDLPEAGTFECSSKLINDIHAMMRRTYLSNMHGLPTDCPHREKLGWMCDGFMASEMGMWNFDGAALYAKWIRDMADDQEPDGSVSPIVPGTGWGKGSGDGCFDPLWTGVTVFMPWQLYQMYGDSRILAEHFDAMRRHVDVLESKSVDGLIAEPSFNILGDWLEVDFKDPKSTRTPNVFAGNAAWFQCADLVSKSAAVLGQPEVAKRYADLAARIRTAINAKWFDPAKGRYVFEDSQCGPAQALMLGIAPDASRPGVLTSLLENIKQRNGHLSTGIVGTYYLFKALGASANDDVAWEIATQTDYPSWGGMLSKGATTVWENWLGGSLNHPALGSPGFWFYQGIAGIRRAAPGFSKIIVQPGVFPGLDWAKATYAAPYGEIRSAWKRDGDRLTLEVTVPPGVTAEVFVPTNKMSPVSESNKRLQPARMEADHAVFAIGSGNYVFQSTLPENMPAR